MKVDLKCVKESELYCVDKGSDDVVAASIVFIGTALRLFTYMNFVPLDVHQGEQLVQHELDLLGKGNLLQVLLVGLPVGRGNPPDALEELHEL